MIATSIQINDLLPDTFVKVLLNNGRQKFGFLLNDHQSQDQLVLMSGLETNDRLGDISIDAIDMNSVISIDPYMK